MPDPTPERIGSAARLGNALGRAVRPATREDQLRRATADLRAIFGAAACSCALVDPDGASIRFVAANGVGADSIVGVTMGIERGIAGCFVLTGQPIAVADVRADPRFAKDVAEQTSYVPTSIMAAPLTADDGTVLGVVEVLDRAQTGDNSGRDLDVLATVANQLAATVALTSGFDRLGEVLVASLARTASDEDFSATIAELAAGGGSAADLARLAGLFNDLASAGPAGTTLAESVLAAVATFAKARP